METGRLAKKYVVAVPIFLNPSSCFSSMKETGRLAKKAVNLPSV